MDIVELLLKEMDLESGITRRIVQALPDNMWEWKPYAKSMSIKSLTVHIAELPGWVTMALTLNEIDFDKKPYQQTPVQNKAQLLNLLESSLSEAALRWPLQKMKYWISHGPYVAET